jgi:hypothetical protein
MEHALNQTNRRVFMMTLAAGTSALATAAMAQAKLDEKDPTAMALGYVADTTKADKKKYAKHDAAQKCSNCQLFQGRPAPPKALPAVPGKSVAANGWCASCEEA